MSHISVSNILPYRTRSGRARSEPIRRELVLNMTEGTFFVYKDGKYSELLKPLFEKQAYGTSRWRITDKIIFVPEHLVGYVANTYERVYPRSTKGKTF